MSSGFLRELPCHASEKRNMIEPQHAKELTCELAAAAGLTEEEATRVLAVFQIDKLVNNSNKLAEGLQAL